MTRGKAFGAVAAFGCAGLLVIWWTSGAPTASQTVAEGPPVEAAERPQARPPTPPHQPTQSRRPDAPPEPARAPPSPVQEAVQSHAERAGPKWRRAAVILGHADPPVYGDIARGLAGRLESASDDGMELSRLQELLVEERQLVEHLKRRYEGIPELQQHLAGIDDSLLELEDSLQETGPSPDPRD